MRKDLEIWLRGGTQEPETAADAADVEETAGEAGLSVSHENEIESSEEENAEENTEENEDNIEEIETAVEKFPVKDLSEAANEAEEPASEPGSAPIEPDEPDGNDVNEIYDKDENSYEYTEYIEKRPAGGLLEQARSRLSAMRMTRMKESQRVGHIYERSGFRRNRGRFLTICVLAIIVAGTAVALYRNMQRNSYDAIMERAGGLYEQKQYAAASEAYNDASQRYPDRVEPFLGAAHAAERMGRVEESIAAYQASLERLPSDDTHSRAGVFYEIGRLHSTLKAWEKAQESFEEAVAADAANYAAYFSLGDSFEEQDQPDKALEAYKRAQELSPSSDAAGEAVMRVSLALAVKEEDAKDALVEQKYAQALSSGGAALKATQYREASRYFSEALAIRSDDADAWAGFAEARGKLGDAGGERKSLERALERDPEHEGAKSRLAEIEAQNKKKPAGNTTSRRRDSSPSPIQEMPGRETMFRAGVDHYRNGEYEAAFNSFAACLRSSEREPLPPVSLAGETGAAWKAPLTGLNIPTDASLLADIVRLNPKDRNLYVNLSIAGAKMGADRKTLRSVLSEARTHALQRANDA